jgi:hypothetical protein
MEEPLALAPPALASSPRRRMEEPLLTPGRTSRSGMRELLGRGWMEELTASGSCRRAGDVLVSS